MSSNSGRSGRLVRRTSALSRRGLQFVRRAALGGLIAGSTMGAGHLLAQDQTGTANNTTSSFGGANITMNGGTLTLNAIDDTNPNALLERFFDPGTAFTDANIDPIAPSNANSLLVLAPFSTGVLRNDNLSWDGPLFATRAGITTGNDTLGGAWHGRITVGGTSAIPAGDVTFATRSDDGSVFWVDLDQNGTFDPAELIVNNKGGHGNQNRAGSVNLAAGTYNVAIAWYEGTGGELIEARVAPGVTGFAPGNTTNVADGTYDDWNIVNPGAGNQRGAWDHIGAALTPNFSANAVSITANATIAADNRAGLTTQIGALSIDPGVTLTKTGGAIGTPSATVSGAGAVTVNSAGGVFNWGTYNTGGAAVALTKSGAGELVLGNAANAVGAGSSFNAQAGTMTLLGTSTTSGAGTGSITLSGGTLRLRGDTEVNPNTLIERYIDGWFRQNGGDQLLDPIDPILAPGSLTAAPALATGQLRQPLDYASDAAFNTKSGNLVGTDGMGGAWVGELTVGGPNLPAGDITFGTRSDDGSTFWIDLNQNGTFDVGAGELIVSNKGSHGLQNRAGSVNLAAGTYKIAMGWYEGDGGAGVNARFAAGVSGFTPGDTTNIVDGTYNAWTIINPAAANQTGIWSATGPSVNPNFSSSPVSVTANSTINVAAAAAQLGSLTINPGTTLTKTGGDLNVTTTNTSGSGATLNVTNIMRPGTLNVPSGATVTKTGGGDLVLNPATSSGLVAGSTLAVSAGRIIAPGDATGNSLGASAVNLTAGTLQLVTGNPGTAGVSGPIVGNFYAGVAANDALFVPVTGLDSLIPNQTASTVTEINFATSNGNPWFYPNGSPVLDDLATPVNVGDDNHASRFTGTFNVAAAGEVTLFTESDDGSVMWIDFNNDTVFSPNEEVISNRGAHGMVRVTNAMMLAAGNYNFKVEHWEAGGGSGLIANAVGPTNYANTVTVTNGSTIDVVGQGVANVATLNILANQTLTKTGVNRLRTTTTNLNGNATIAVNAGDMAINQLVDGANTGTLTKSGGGALILDQAGSDINGTTISVTGGSLRAAAANVLAGVAAVNVSNGGALVVTHADGISATTPVNILPSGYVDFDVTQSGPRTLAVPALGAVIGKLGNLTYGAAGPNNISFVTNSVLGPDEGETNVPTQAQVGGARLLLGLTSNTQNVTVGGNVATADPADIYRGVAIGQWISAGNLSATLNSAGTQDLNIQIIPPGVSQNGNAVFKNIAPTTSFNSGTGVVNMDGQARIVVASGGGGIAGNWTTLNRTGDPNFRGGNNVIFELGTTGGTGGTPSALQFDKVLNIRHGSFNMPGSGGVNTSVVAFPAFVNIREGGGLILDDSAANSPTSGVWNIFGAAGTFVLDTGGNPIDVNKDGIVDAADASSGPGAIYIQQNDQNTLGGHGNGQMLVHAGEGFLLVLDGDNISDDPGLVQIMHKADIILDDADRDDFQTPIVLGNGRRLTTTANLSADINNDGAIQRLAAAPGLSGVPGAKVILSAAEQRTLDINDRRSDFTGVDLQVGDPNPFTTTEGFTGASQAFNDIRLARISTAQTGLVRLSGVIANNIYVESGRLFLEDNSNNGTNSTDANVTLTDPNGNFYVRGGSLYVTSQDVQTAELTAGTFGRAGAEIQISGGANVRLDIQQQAGTRTVLQKFRTVGAGKAQLFIGQGGLTGGTDVLLQDIVLAANSNLNLASIGGTPIVRANIDATAGGGSVENNSTDTNVRVTVNAGAQPFKFLGSRATRINSTVTASQINVGEGLTQAGILALETAGQVGATPIVNSSFSELRFNPGAANTIAYNSANLTNNGLLRVQSGTLDMTGQTLTSTAPALTIVPGLQHSVQPAAFSQTEANRGTDIQLSPTVAATSSLEGIPPFAEINSTHVYSGEIFDADGIVAFAEQFDDSVLLKIDMNNNGTFEASETVLNNGAFNVPTTTDGDTVAAGVQPLNIGAGDGGWHAFELRLGQGTGGVGTAGNQGGANWPFLTFGFGYNPNPPATIPNAIQQSNYQPLVDNGSGTLLRSRLNPGAGDIQVDASTTMNAGAYRNYDAVSASGRLNLTPNGTDAGTSTSQSLTTPGTGVIDLANNDLIVRSTAATKDAEHAAIQADILSAQNGVDANFITKWDGPGLTSSTARTSNLASNFDLVGIGVIRNSDIDVLTGLPGSSYTTFSGQAVAPDDILVKYTYIGDGNLDGLVSFDDYVGMDNAFFGLIPNLGWATGDINFDGVINFDDYTVVDQAFFFQGAPLSGEASVSAVPEPGTWLLAALASLAGLVTWFRRKK